MRTPQPGIDNAHRKRTDNRGRDEGSLSFLDGPRAGGHATVSQEGVIFNADLGRQVFTGQMSTRWAAEFHFGKPIEEMSK
jgi:hypothetical protein